jgi:hypothetical protein
MQPRFKTIYPDTLRSEDDLRDRWEWLRGNRDVNALPSAFGFGFGKVFLEEFILD